MKIEHLQKEFKMPKVVQENFSNTRRNKPDYLNSITSHRHEPCLLA